jgi:hypothetical protein
MPVQTTIQVRRDTAINWYTQNPTLDSGEWGLETDTRLIKIGSGSAWNSTDYFNNPFGGLKWQTGKYYRTAFDSNYQGASVSFSDTSIVFSPLIVPNTITITSIIAGKSGPNSTVGATIALYSASSDTYQPYSKITQTAAGSNNWGTPTNGSRTFTVSWTVTAGIYYIAIMNTTANGQAGGVTGTNTRSPMFIHSSTDIYSGSTSFTDTYRYTPTVTAVFDATITAANLTVTQGCPSYQVGT